MPGLSRSSMYRPCPVIIRWSSVLGIRCPTNRAATPDGRTTGAVSVLMSQTRQRLFPRTFLVLLADFRRRRLGRLDDALVAGAPAQVPRQPIPQFFLARV